MVGRKLVKKKKLHLFVTFILHMYLLIYYKKYMDTNYYSVLQLFILRFPCNDS